MRIRTSVVCVFEGAILVFKAIDPTSGQVYWFLPGGKIEPGETAAACGERETWEETGYRVSVLPSSCVTKLYKHWWDGTEHACETHFFRAELVGAWHPPAAVVDAPYNLGPAWLSVEEALQSFAYTSEIRDAVAALL